MSDIKYNNGSSWVDLSGYYHDGVKWVDMQCFYNNGSSWVRSDYQTQTYKKTWTANWSQCYRGNNTKRDTQYLYQGRADGVSIWGVQRGLIGFDTGQISRELQGAKIVSCKVTIYSKHAWYNSGCTYRLGFHNHSSKPTNFSQSAEYVLDIKGGKPGKFTANLTSKGLAEGIRDGRYKGVSLYCGNSTSLNYYGYCHGVGQSNPPTIEIEYVK